MGTMENLSGGTTNLLRMARSECRADAAFVALALDDDMFATATYRAVPDDELFRSEAVDELIRQAWSDPELAQGRALVRVARLTGRRLAPAKRLALAILPLVDAPAGRPWGLLGVAGPEAGSFDTGQIELLGRIAQRLSSYFRARQEVRHKISEDAAVAQAAPPPGAGGAVIEPEPAWTVEPATTTATTAPAGAPGPGWSAVLEREPESAGVRPEPTWDRPATPQEPELLLGEPHRVSPQVPPSRAVPEPAWAVADVGVAHRSVGAEAGPPPLPPATDPLGDLLRGEDPSTGLLPLGALLGRAGRMLGAAGSGGGSLALVVIELVAGERIDDEVGLMAAHALRGQLRFDDPLARIGATAFAAVVPLVPGSSSGVGVEEHLAETVRSAVAHDDVVVRSAHVTAGLDERRDADELLRAAVGKLRGV